ncbi:histidine phosphatase superfamily [Mycotypha africana]|uniref:histidine phosphatase superfamily n=1 Tax=Mycotypha africana TaxID=64632 RepID=UPI0023000268|nr:histidine phosphatase superfamily [Mycotypha africana]KAI8968375.1 histidine phosphatase superfamily [Mycotypha africana]
MKVTLLTAAVIAFLRASVTTASAEKIDQHGQLLDIAYVTKHIGTHRGYPTESIPNKDHIDNDYILEQYQLIKRHGTRYPGDDDIDAMNELNDSLTGWTNNYDNQWVRSRTGLLDLHGQMEHYTHGERVAASYPEIVKSAIDFDVSTLTAYASWSDRVSQSASAFLMGAFKGYGQLGKDNTMAIPIFTYPEEEDKMLAFHKACKRWKTEIDDSDFVDKAVKPLDKLYKQTIATRLSKDLGLHITATDVENLMSGCAFDVTMRGTADTFCRLFTKDDLIKLEYYDDLKHWFKLSYGYEELNAGMACNLGKAIIENIEAAVHGSTTGKKFPRLDLKFGHDETLLPLRTFFGLQKDDYKLAWNLSQHEIDNRKFKLSKFSFFANNLAFQVLSSKNKTNTQKYVRVLDNEKAIIFPGCQHEYCPHDQFLEAVAPMLTCDYDETCAI